MKMIVVVMTMVPGNVEKNVSSWLENADAPHTLVIVEQGVRGTAIAGEMTDLINKPWNILWDCLPENIGWLAGAQRQFERSEGFDILAYLHDDLLITEKGWDARVLHEFEDPTVAVVGFGGAKGLGHEDLYKISFHTSQLARHDFISNLDDAEHHGSRLTGVEDCAFLDSYSLFIRRSLLVETGGWPVERYAPSHLMDAWISLSALTHGYRCRVVGVAHKHFSGGAGPDYHKWAATTKWGSDAAMHTENHKVIAEEFRGFLPYEVK